MQAHRIALLTDFGIRDPYVGVMKGVIYSISADTSIVDITHEIGTQNIHQASFILEKTFRYFPSGTIFVVVIDPGVGSSRKALAVKTRSYHFVAPDNGVLASALNFEEIIEIVEISNPRYMLENISNTFHGRDVFAPAAAHISRGIPLKHLGEKVDHYMGLDIPKAHKISGGIKGRVVYMDHFGNLITNIEREDIGDKPVAAVRAGGYLIRGMNQYYSQSKAGELLAIMGSFNTLEISVNRGSAASIMGYSHHMEVEVWFQEKDIPSGSIY